MLDAPPIILNIARAPPCLQGWTLRLPRAWSLCWLAWHGAGGRRCALSRCAQQTAAKCPLRDLPMGEHDCRRATMNACNGLTCTGDLHHPPAQQRHLCALRRPVVDGKRPRPLLRTLAEGGRLHQQRWNEVGFLPWKALPSEAGFSPCGTSKLRFTCNHVAGLLRKHLQMCSCGAQHCWHVCVIFQIYQSCCAVGPATGARRSTC